MASKSTQNRARSLTFAASLMASSASTTKTESVRPGTTWGFSSFSTATIRWLACPGFAQNTLKDTSRAARIGSSRVAAAIHGSASSAVVAVMTTR